MTEPGYPVARAVALRAETLLGRHRAVAQDHGVRDVAASPDAAAIEALVDIGFWASLRREEGRPPRISLAFVPPEATRQPLTFARWLPFSAAALAKLAPAVERPGIHLGVWRDTSGELGVWGTTRDLPAYCFVLEVVSSGVLVIKHRGETSGKFVNVAVLEGDQIKVVDESVARRPDCPRVVASLLGVDIPGVPMGADPVLVQLAASMRAHGRGGALLVIPAVNSTWTESIVTPVLYGVSPPFSGLATLVHEELAAPAQPDRQEPLRRAVDALAGLTAVDGATLVSERFELLAFGAKITRRRGNPTLERVLLTEPIEGSPKALVGPSQLGGTRHFSAAQFVYDQRDATALVASQDGRFTVFKWSAEAELVHAHRVEALLL